MGLRSIIFMICIVLAISIISQSYGYSLTPTSRVTHVLSYRLLVHTANGYTRDFTTYRSSNRYSDGSSSTSLYLNVLDAPTTPTTDLSSRNTSTVSSNHFDAISSNIKTWKMSMPNITLPQVSLPQVSLPQVSLPQVSLPQVSLPQVSLPQVSLPQVSLPQVSLPQVSLGKTLKDADRKAKNVYSSVSSAASSSLIGFDWPWNKYYRGEIPFFESRDFKIGENVGVTGEHTRDAFPGIIKDSKDVEHKSESIRYRIVATPIRFLKKLFPITASAISTVRRGRRSSAAAPTAVIKQIRHQLRALNIRSNAASIGYTLSRYIPGLKLIYKRRSRNYLNYFNDQMKGRNLLDRGMYGHKHIVATDKYINDMLNSYDPSSPSNLVHSKFPFPLITNSTYELYSQDNSIFVNGSSVSAAEKIMMSNIDDVKITALEAPSVAVIVNSNITFKAGRAVDYLALPNVIHAVPHPSQIDLAYISHRKALLATDAALAITSPNDAKQYLAFVGLQPLIDSVLIEVNNEDDEVRRIRGVKGLCKIIRVDKNVADIIGVMENVINVLVDIMEQPFGRFRMLRSEDDRLRLQSHQREAVALVQRIIRSSDIAVESMKCNRRLTKVLEEIVSSNKHVHDHKHAVMRGKEIWKQSKNMTILTEYSNLKTHQMARVASWGLGGGKWKPKFNQQKGLRILSFDGGGTRGVLTIALLKEIMQRCNCTHPHELFDIICGTSTGGIISMLLGGQQESITVAENMYDDFVNKVFSNKSNLKLVSDKAMYDERELEKVIYSLCGDKLLLDVNMNECPRVFCVSTKINVNPPQIQIWRNYNYPAGQSSRYDGTFRINSVTAVRATTAAPTFFTPVPFEGGLYCDGALVANNPTAVALQEAKALYPNVPIEMVLSIGTGFSSEDKKVESVGWDYLVSQIIATSVDTEDVHTLMKDFLPAETYFRINPQLIDNLPIDEIDKSRLQQLKKIAKDYISKLEIENPKKMNALIAFLTQGRKK